MDVQLSRRGQNALEAEAFQKAVKRFENESSKFRTFQIKYRNDPLAFVHDCVAFTGGNAPTQYQSEILSELVSRKRIAVRGPHGIGKTSLASWVILWAVLTEDDCKIPTTASAWRQLTKFLWPEVHKWVGRLKWNIIGREPFSTRDELLTQSLKRGATCEAFALASNNAALIEGAHGKRVVYIYDEAKAIPPETWDATEGAFAGAGEDTDNDAFALAIGTPGETSGRFYDIHRRTPGYEDWWVRHVTLEEAIKAGRISRQWADRRRRQWGKDTAVYQNRVLGEFASSGEDTIIPLAWVEEANRRWQEWDDAGQPTLEGEHCFGLDVARYGPDKSCLAERIGVAIVSLDIWGKKSTMETAGRVKPKLKGAPLNGDVIGVGAGTIDRLREQGEEVYGINFGADTTATDSSGEIEMLNVRAAAWWGMRELLESPSEVMLPPNDGLIGDLTAPKYTYTSSGKLKVESKDEIRKRLKRSPDVGDAVVLAYWKRPEKKKPGGRAVRLTIGANQPQRRQDDRKQKRQRPTKQVTLVYTGTRSFPLQAGGHSWMISAGWERKVDKRLAEEIAGRFGEYFRIRKEK